MWSVESIMINNNDNSPKLIEREICLFCDGFIKMKITKD